MKTKLFFMLSAVALMTILPLSAAKYYLYTGSDPWGTRTDGTKVKVAAGTLHTTLNTYAASDVIWIAAGTYTTSTSPAAIALKEGMSVYGGFFGNETTISQRQLADEAGGNGVVEPWEMKYPTIINGTGSAESLSTYVMFDQSTNYILDGVTVDTHYVQTANGGAIYNRSTTAKPIISNCIFRNIRKSGPTPAAAASGTVIYEGGMGTITCCLIENNVLTATASTTAGGTIFANANPTITRNVIRNNSLNGNTEFQVYGSAIFLRGTTAATPAGLIANNVIYNNTSRSSAIYINGGNCAHNIVNNTIVNNFSTSTTGSHGGAVYNIPASAKIYNNIVYNNAKVNLTKLFSFTAAKGAAVDLQNNAYNGITVNGNSESSFVSIKNSEDLATPNFVNPSTTMGYSVVMPADVKAANFALKSSAKALIDKGGLFQGITPSIDILGNPRPIESNKIDIGAYEFSK